MYILRRDSNNKSNYNIQLYRLHDHRAVAEFYLGHVLDRGPGPGHSANCTRRHGAAISRYWVPTSGHPERGLPAPAPPSHFAKSLIFKLIVIQKLFLTFMCYKLSNILLDKNYKSIVAISNKKNIFASSVLCECWVFVEGRLVVFNIS